MYVAVVQRDLVVKVFMCLPDIKMYALSSYFNEMFNASLYDSTFAVPELGRRETYLYPRELLSESEVVDVYDWTWIHHTSRIEFGTTSEVCNITWLRARLKPPDGVTPEKRPEQLAAYIKLIEEFGEPATVANGVPVVTVVDGKTDSSRGN